MKLFGRTTELAAMSAHLEDGYRIVTLIGPAGVGKTRIAKEFAGEAVPICSLVDARTADDVAQVVLQTLATASPPERAVAEVLKSHGLVVLDNLDHILDEVAPMVERWAMVTPIVATSRQRLHLSSEAVVAIEPLPLDVAASLVEQRAIAAGAAPLTSTESRAIADAVDRLPLALELAAARVRSVGPDRLIKLLREPLSALTRSPRGGPSRHKSMERAIECSWRLLDEPQRQALGRLAMLVDAFDVGDAAAILTEGAALDVVETLVEQSLLQPERGKFRMLKPIQAFAQQRAATAGWVDEELLCARAEELFRRGRHDECLYCLDNVEVQSSRVEEVRSWAFRRLGRLEDARLAGQRALALLSEPASARLLGSLAVIALEQGDLEEARAGFMHLREVGDDPHSHALATGMIGHVDQELGRLSEAAQRYDEAASGLEELGDLRLSLAYRGYRATVSHERGDADARQRYERVIAAFGDRWPRFRGLFNICLGALHGAAGDENAARNAFDLGSDALTDCQDPALLRASEIHQLWLEPTTTRLPPSDTTSDDVRFAERLQRKRRATSKIHVGDRCVEIGGEQIDLRPRRVLWRVFLALVAGRRESPDHAVPRHALIEAGWPNERIRPRAAAHRLRVAIHELRRKGLAEQIVRTEDGYHLACDVTELGEQSI